MVFVYMLRNGRGRLYIGVSTDPESRCRYHNAKRGAQFTHDRYYRIVFMESYDDMSAARKRERQLKNWRREKKDMLIERYLEGLTTKL